MVSQSEQFHNHAYGRDACGHPECVKADQRRVDKIIAISIANKILKDNYQKKDILELAKITVRLLED